MCRVIILANQKGGVAKTTSTVNIGIGLARLGKKVLLIDNDPQGSLSQALGYPQPDKMEVSLANIYEWVLNEDDFDLDEGILHHEEGVDIMPGNKKLTSVEMAMVSIIGSEGSLREYTDMMRDSYDYILVDCSPNLGKLTINALVAADEVLIPTQATYLALKGLEQLLKTISLVRRKMNPRLKILGTLITMVDSRTLNGKEITEIMYQYYGDKMNIYNTSIPFSVRAAEASTEGMGLSSKVCKFFLRVCQVKCVNSFYTSFRNLVRYRVLTEIPVMVETCL